MNFSQNFCILTILAYKNWLSNICERDTWGSEIWVSYIQGVTILLRTFSFEYELSIVQYSQNSNRFYYQEIRQKNWLQINIYFIKNSNIGGKLWPKITRFWPKIKMLITIFRKNDVSCQLKIQLILSFTFWFKIGLILSL